MSRVRVYMACSLNGYIAGPGDDLTFLNDPELGAAEGDGPGDGLSFEAFMSEVGALLMGRRTHDVVKGLGVWVYGETPVLVATRRPLDPAAPTVRAVAGDIGALVEAAREAAQGRDVYLDGADLIRQALDAGVVDEICVTVVPTLLPAGGVRLFDGLLRTTKLEFAAPRSLGRMVQLTARVRR